MLVHDGVIAAVGPAHELTPRHPDVSVEAFRASVLVPGFVDAHCHTEWALLPSAGALTSFGRWLAAFLPRRARMLADDHRIAADLASLRLSLAGTTAVADSGPTGAGAPALRDAGLRAIVHVETFGGEEGGAAAEKAAALEAQIDELDELAGARGGVGVSPHAPYTVGPAYWSALRARPGLDRRPWATHLAESEDETRLLDRGDGPLVETFASMGFTPPRWEGRPGERPVRRVARAGGLREDLLAAHCIELDDPDVAALVEHAVAAVHCPSSNRQLGCNRMPLARLREAGATVALGSDSPASGGLYDIRVEARAAQVLHGSAVTPEELLRMATIEGARALGIDDLCGTITPGKRADLVAIALPDGAEDPIAGCLGGGSAVGHVMVDGEPIVRRGEPVRTDAERVLTRAAEAQERLC